MLERLLDFYRNLLIIQYNNQPKAAATIDAVIKEVLANALFFDVRDGFNIDTAVGKQLDVIGKYVGVDRSFKGDQFPGDFFSVVATGELTPFADKRKGLVPTADWQDAEGSWLTYDDLVSVTNLLFDEDYRTIIKLKILFNNINVSHAEIDEALAVTFGSKIIPDSVGNMEMIYFINRERIKIAGVAIEKDVLPKPAGVKIKFIVRKNDPMLQFATYDRQNAAVGFTGFTTHNDFDSQSGEVLTYNKLTGV